MRLTKRLRGNGSRRVQGYTFLEVIVAVLVLSLMMVSLYGGISLGFSVLSSSREDLRATQILVRKTEAIRLFTWSELLDSTNYLRPTFTERYDPLSVTNGSGPMYTGVISLSTPTNLPDAYATNMRTVTISVYWTNYSGKASTVRVRQMETRVARYGIQNYVWGAL